MEESGYGDFKVAVDLTPFEVQWVVRSLISTIDDLYEQVLFWKADAKDTSIKMQEQIDALWKENAKLNGGWQRMELKPCPFCGGEARLIEAEIGMFEDGYAVYCDGTCGVKMGVGGRLGEAYKWTPSFSTEAEAIEAWNTRAELTAKPTRDKLGFAYCGECGWNVGAATAPFRYCSHCGRKVEE